MTMLRIQIRNGKEHLQQCVATLAKQKFWEDVPVVFESEDNREDRMSDKDQKAFEKFIIDKCGSTTEASLNCEWYKEIWQAACEYKQKEIDELKYCSQVFYEATKKVGW